MIRVRVLIPVLAMAAAARAGPPFLTDDPEPVDFRHWEAYLFASGDRTDVGDAVNAPAVELNYGILPDTQLHLVVPVASVTTPGGPTEAGLGDTEFGIKVRFAHESATAPQAGIFPMIELPTGNSARGLGNGRAWYRLPLWLQKSWRSWTTYGGGGIALNSAPGQRTHGFAGWLLQRNFGPHLTLGGEVFSEQAEATGERGFTAVNLGGAWNLTGHTSILFSFGRSFHGERHTLWYISLYRTWGPAPGGRS